MIHEKLALSKEKGRTSELLGEGAVGLQARLLTGDLINPRLRLSRKKLRPIAERGVKGISRQTADIYGKASVRQRRRHQEETGLTLSRWEEGFNAYLEGIRQDTKQRQRKEFLKDIGISDTVDAKKFYGQYLQGGSDIIKFVDMIAQVATPEQIARNQDIIKNLGNAFGYESSEVIDHLIRGIRNVKTDMNAFIHQAKKTVNTPFVLNDPLLQKIRHDTVIERLAERQAQTVAMKPTRPSERLPQGKVRVKPTRRVNVDTDEEERQEEILIFPAPVQK